ncbi:MAG: hypothetical protein ACYDH6_17925 [Acidimicrobiales bacterium]
MALLWIVPAGIALVGSAVLAGLVRRAAEEVGGLREQLDRWTDRS